MIRHYLLLFLPIGAGAYAAPPAEYFWFKNETQCGTSNVTVRSYCEASAPIEGATVQRNSMCTEQQLLIEESGKKKVRRNLLEHKRRDFLLAWRMTCTKSGDTPYLYIGLANGGNCKSCDSDAVLDLSGRWVHDGTRWFVGGAARRDIVSHESAWYKQDFLHLTNTTVDTDQD